MQRGVPTHDSLASWRWGELNLSFKNSTASSSKILLWWHWCNIWLTHTLLWQKLQPFHNKVWTKWSLAWHEIVEIQDKLICAYKVLFYIKFSGRVVVFVISSSSRCLSPSVERRSETLSRSSSSGQNAAWSGHQRIVVLWTWPAFLWWGEECGQKGSWCLGRVVQTTRLPDTERAKSFVNVLSYDKCVLAAQLLKNNDKISIK